MKNPLVLIFAFAFATTVILATGGNQLSNVQTGKASYYGREFEGRKTASGEIFRNGDFTCAQKYSFGTILKVTNQKIDYPLLLK